MKVQDIRDLMRPFLTIWFSVAFVGIISVGLYATKMDFDKALLAIDGILGTVIGYHFGKSAKKDSEDGDQAGRPT